MIKKDNFSKAGKSLTPEKVTRFNKAAEVFDIIGAFAEIGFVIPSAENEK